MNRTHLVQLRAFPKFGLAFLTTFCLAGIRAQADTASNIFAWTIPTLTTTSAAIDLANTASGLSDTAITVGSGQSITSSSSSWRWSQNSTGQSTANDTYANAVAGGKYFQWTLNAGARTSFTITGSTGFLLTPSVTTGTMPQSAVLYDSTDGGTTWNQVGTSATYGGAQANVGNSFFSSPITVNAGGSLMFRMATFLGATQASSSPKIAWNGTTTTTVASDAVLLGTTTGGAWNIIWNGTASQVWDTNALNWQTNTAGTGTGPNIAMAGGDNVTFGNSATNATINVTSGGVTAGNVNVTNTAGTVTLAGGSVGGLLYKSGNGTLDLTAANAFTGGTISAGTVVADANSALGTGGSAGISLNGGGLSITNASVTAVSAKLAAGNSAGGSVDVTNGATVNLSGGITAAGTSTGGNKGDASTYSTMTLNPTGTGTIILSSAVGSQMSVTGPVVTTAGAISLQIPHGTVILTNSATLNLGTGILGVGTNVGSYNGMTWNGNVDMLGSTLQMNGGNINGSGIIDVGMQANGVAATNTTSTLASRLNFPSPTISNAISIEANNTLALNSPTGGGINIAGPISGSGTITVNANPTTLSGVATLSGNSSFSGTITDANVLKVTGNVGSATLNVTGTSAILTVSGGTVGPTTFSGATETLNVGTGSTTNSVPGSMTVNGALTLRSDTASFFTLTNTVNAGTDFSQLSVNGAFNYASSAINFTLNNTNSLFAWNPAVINVINFTSEVGDASAVTFNDYTGTNPVVSVSLTEATPGSGLWSGLDGANTITFNAASGTLAVNSVPEPGTCAMVGLGISALAVTIIRRRRND